MDREGAASSGFSTRGHTLLQRRESPGDACSLNASYRRAFIRTAGLTVASLFRSVQSLLVVAEDTVESGTNSD